MFAVAEGYCWNDPFLSWATFYPIHQWLFQISMKLPLAKIELGPIYDRLEHKFSFSGLKMRLADL